MNLIRTDLHHEVRDRKPVKKLKHRQGIVILSSQVQLFTSFSPLFPTVSHKFQNFHAVESKDTVKTTYKLEGIHSNHL